MLIAVVVIVRWAVGFGTGRTVFSGTERSGSVGFGSRVGVVGGAVEGVSAIVSATSEQPTRAAVSSTATTNRPIMVKK